MSISKKFYSVVLAILAVFALVGCTLPTSFSRTVSEAEADLAYVADSIFFTEADLEVVSDLEFTTTTGWAEKITFDWSTSNEAVIAKDGKVTRPEYGLGNAEVVVKVVITAEYTKLDDGTFKLGTVSTEKEWTFTVLEAGKVYTIADIKNDLTFVADETEVSFKGVVVAFSNYKGGHYPFVYDGTDGMYVYIDSPEVKVGDYVQVNAKYDVYYNLVQVSDGGVTVLESGAELPAVEKEQISEVVAAKGYMISETVGVAAGKVHNVDAKVVVETSGGYENAYLQDPFTGERFIVHYETGFDYVPGNTAETYLDLLKSYDGKYVNITVTNYDRKDGEERVCLSAYPIVEIEEPKLTDEQQATIIINNLVVSETCETELSLPTEAVWEVVSGTGIEIVDGVAVVTQADKDQEVVLKATVTVGEATLTKEFVVTVKGIFIEILTPTQALEQVKNEENNGKEVYIRGEIAEGSKLDKYGNMDLVDYDGVTSINIYGSFGKDAEGNYLFASIKEELGLEVGVSVVLRGTYYTSKGNITGLEIVEVVPTPITPSEAYEAVQVADNNGKEVLIIGKITEDSKLDKYGNMVLQDVNGTGTISIYGSFGKDAEGNYIFASIKEELGLAAGKVVVLRGTYYNSKSNVTGLEIVAVVEMEVEEHEHVKCPICELCTDANCPGTAEEKCAGHEVTGEQKTVSVVVADYASANGWVNSTLYDTMNVDSNVAIKVSGTPVGSYGLNSGKFYTNGNAWRIYQNEKPEITFVAGVGCQIASVKITYTVSNTGVLTLNGSNVESDAVVDVNASTITFSVGNTGTATNGQVRITAVEVVYVGGASETPHEHEYVNGKCECGELDPEHVHAYVKGQCVCGQINKEAVEVTLAEAAEYVDGAAVIITGTVKSIDSAWDEYYKNLCVTLEDETGTLYIFRLATKVNEGDKIKVTGFVGSYNGSKQIAAGATAEILEAAPQYIDITVYYKNTENWAAVSTWIWNETENFTGGNWPGAAMTLVEGTESWYSYSFKVLSVEGLQVIFNNNGAGSQTSDLPYTGLNYWYGKTAYATMEEADAAHASDNTVWSEWYLRGDMNSWGTADRLQEDAEGNAWIVADLVAGQTFKVADSGWSKEFNSSHVSHANFGGSGNIEVLVSGKYKLTVTAAGALEITEVVEETVTLATVTLTANVESNYNASSEGEDVTSCTSLAGSDIFTLTVGAPTAAYKNQVYFATSGQIRLYSDASGVGNTLTIKSTKKIVSIAITYEAANRSGATFTIDGTTLAGATDVTEETIDVNGYSITIANNKTSGQVRLVSVVITYEA